MSKSSVTEALTHMRRVKDTPVLTSSLLLYGRKKKINLSMEKFGMKKIDLKNSEWKKSKNISNMLWNGNNRNDLSINNLFFSQRCGHLNGFIVECKVIKKVKIPHF